MKCVQEHVSAVNECLCRRRPAIFYAGEEEGALARASVAYFRQQHPGWHIQVHIIMTLSQSTPLPLFFHPHSFTQFLSQNLQSGLNIKVFICCVELFSRKLLSNKDFPTSECC